MNCRNVFTDFNGSFSFAGVPNGNYVIVETDLVDYNSTSDTNLPNDNQIFLTITNLASSSGNNFLDTIDASFCVAPNPSTGFVINTNPADGASGITLNTNTLTVTFRGPMITSGGGSVIDAGNYELKNQQNGNDVTILGVTYDARNHISHPDHQHSRCGLESRFAIPPPQVKSGIKSACDVGQGVDVDHFFTTEMQITGQVRNDLDGDGNPADGDDGIYGATVQLSDGACTLGVNCRSTATDLNGNFSFIGLTPGNYSLVETDLPGYVSTSDSDGGTDNQIAIVLAGGTNSLGNYFLDRSSCVASDPVTGYVLSSTPANGAMGVSLGITTLQVTFNQPMSTTGGGSVLDIGNFDNKIVNVSLGGDVPITNVSYNSNTKTVTLTINTSDADWKAGSQYRLRVKGGIKSACDTGQGINVDHFFTTEMQITGQVRNDLDGDGNPADGDDGIYGATVQLSDGACTLGVNCRSTATDLNGNFSFIGLTPGNYSLVETDLPGYVSTSDSDGGTDNQIAIVLAGGTNSLGNYFLDRSSCVASDPVTGYVLSSTPANGTTGVSLGTTTLQVTFNQPMSTTGGGSVLDIGNFDNKIVNMSLGGDVPITNVSYNSNTKTVTLTINTSDADWKAGSQYRLRVKDGIKSACDTGQGINVDHFFTTEMQITGQVRNDLDGDGNPADGDDGIYGATVQLSDGACTLGVNCRSTATDLNGNFSFIGLTPGNYSLVETDLPGYVSTSDSDGGTDNQIAIVLAGGTNSLGNYFLDRSSCVASDPVTGYVLSSTPANGTTGVSLGITTLQVTFNQPMSTTGGGSVLDIGNFDNKIVNMSLGGDVPITNVSYNSNTKTVTLTINTSDADWKAGSQYRLRVKGGIKSACDTGQGINVDILFYTDTQISGQVRHDINANGSLLDPDPGIVGVHIELYNGVCTLGVNCPITNTNAGGFFTFSALVPGTYVIYETDLNGYVSTADSHGANDGQIAVNLVAGTTSTSNIFLDTLVATATPTNTPILTYTPSATLTSIPTLTQTPTSTPSYTPTFTPAATWTPTSTQTPMPTSTYTLVPTYTPTFTPTP